MIILEKLRLHIQQMAPHQFGREPGHLLLEACEELSKFESMKIHAYGLYEKPRDESVEQYVARALDSQWGDVENVRSSLIRLMGVLASKGILTAPEITEIVGCKNPLATYGKD